MYPNLKKISDTIASVSGIDYHHWNSQLVIKRLPAFVIDSVKRNYTRIDKNANNPFYLREDIYDCYVIYRSNESAADIDTINSNVIKKLREMYTNQTVTMSNFIIESSVNLRVNIDGWQDTQIFNFPLKIDRAKKRFE